MNTGQILVTVVAPVLGVVMIILAIRFQNQVVKSDKFTLKDGMNLIIVLVLMITVLSMIGYAFPESTSSGDNRDEDNRPITLPGW